MYSECLLPDVRLVLVAQEQHILRAAPGAGHTVPLSLPVRTGVSMRCAVR